MEEAVQRALHALNPVAIVVSISLASLWGISSAIIRLSRQNRAARRKLSQDVSLPSEFMTLHQSELEQAVSEPSGLTEAAADELQSARGMISEVHDLIRPRGPNLLLERRVRWAKRRITQARLRMSTALGLLMLLDPEDPENPLYKKIDRVFEGNRKEKAWSQFFLGILTNFLFSLLFIVLGIIIAVSTMQGR